MWKCQDIFATHFKILREINCGQFLPQKVQKVLNLELFKYFDNFSSLEDETPNVREETWETWNQVGKKWVLEEAKHDHKVKEQLDFQAGAELPSHFPTDSKFNIDLFIFKSYLTQWT